MPIPRWFRRVVVAPAFAGILFGLLLTMPIWLLGVGLVSIGLKGRRRLLRVVWLVAVYLVMELVVLIELFGLWLAAGCSATRVRSPKFQVRHYQLVGWVLKIASKQAGRVLKLKITTDGPDPDAHPGRPLLVLCRHAGPGDSFLLTNALINKYAREPRIVLKDTMQWDPAVDVLLNRLPSRFISPNPGASGDAVEAQIAALATGLDENDAFVIFPEGGNFTPKRRAKIIASLKKRGLHRAAQRAEEMIHVLAPRPGGVVAALTAAPEDADVLLVAHTGLDHMLTVADVWRELPMDKTITMRFWLVPAAEVPRDDADQQVEWLYGWWERIDDWIEEHRPSG
ncbi:lysophospholipid acyltransferase family protein [Cryptosporangium arvum]|uniref:1-acyl-sn-glycerol-3-phosphate acyltransferase n=1 Tax=Cryptosporangium arvum DSM 44712 TaxID=927661 RepID=A0A010ZNY4_9ACTN|nr:lysophospholipid acyltransferase family protein [Cryptosporangium arvum]EXG80399.1 1-acyl-sn-glycerol-3-phosphate acyltransferase [Cryptosporangium arvum DSM 44712]